MPDAFDLGSSMEETYAAMQSGGSSDDAGDSGASPSPSPSSAPPTQSPTQAAAPSSTPPAGATSAQVEAWRAMPKSWRKEMESHWGGLQPDVMQYVHEREKQALDGIMQYKSAADKWQQTMDPFKQWFDHYKIDPHDAFKRLASSHIILKYGKPEDRAKWAQQLVQDYGLAEVLGLQGGSPQGASPAPQGNEAIYQMEQRLNAVQEQLYQRQLQENMAMVEKFFGDPANEFAADLQEDILKLFQKGGASTLQEAYEQAKWLNPVVRDKIIQREREAATKPPVRVPPNVKSSSVAPAPTEAADESIEETMRATLQRITSR